MRVCSLNVYVGGVIYRGVVCVCMCMRFFFVFVVVQTKLYIINNVGSTTTEGKGRVDISCYL